MRQAALSATLVLGLSATSCAGTSVDIQITPTTVVSVVDARVLSASQLLETMKWPTDLRPVPLSPRAKNQLQGFIFDDPEIAAAVSDVVAVGVTRNSEPLGALLLVGVMDHVIGNMSFVDGLRVAVLANAATANTETARWGLLVGSVAVVGKEVWAILPAGPVVAFAVATSREDIDQLLEAVSDRVTGGQ
ncbi:MAG: hypothetical protein CL462_06820 [Acidimicrobiaceae bacterium]|nr:hypothetical protein [Acidimicrobiaceae bacterium]